MNHGDDARRRDYTHANREHWNAWTVIHESSAFYDVEGFLAGRQTLLTIELDELGPDIGPGTTLLHLQCHFGLDTLSWARLGARATGVDFSDRAIALARRLAGEVGLDDACRFVQSDLYELPAHLDERFDVVFTSWGVLMWLPDLDSWGRLIARHLRPGGIFYIVDFHPFALALDDARSDLVVRYPCLAGGEPLAFESDSSYAAPEVKTEAHISYEWPHGLGEIVSALTSAGLHLDYLHEFPYCTGLVFPFLDKGDDGWLRVRGHADDFPLSFSIKAHLPAP
jgi:SAM-dependent methyltransferase